MNLLYYPFFVTTTLLLTLAYLVYQYYQHAFKYWSSRNVPFPKPSFPLGNFNRKMVSGSGMIIRDIYNELKKTEEQYGGYYMLAMPVFMPLSPKMYKEVLIKNFQCFQDHGIYHNEESDPFSANIAALQGQNWKHIRAKLSPVFNSVKLKTMFEIMKACSSNIADVLRKSDKIEIHDVAARYTTDIICSCAFGIDENSLKNPDTAVRYYGQKLDEFDFFDSVRIVFGIMSPQILKVFNVSMFNPKVTKFFQNLVNQTVEYREKNNVNKTDLIDMLIRMKHNEDIGDVTSGVHSSNEGEILTLNQIAAQVFFFYLAGFETSSMALTFCLYELARNPNIQQKVREEILKVMEENNGEITYDAINNMCYTDKVVQETMRKYPPILMLNRIVTQRYSVPDSTLTLEEGTRVVISTLGVHHDPEFYPQPDLFDPERFSEEEKAKRPPMTYFPFGDGPRVCIAQKFAIIEMKLALVEFLKNFEFSVHPSTEPTIGTKCSGNMLGLKNKIWLKPTKI